MNRLPKPWFRACLLALCLIASPLLTTISRADEAALKNALDQVASDAPIAVIVPNLKAFSQRMATLSKQLGLPNPDLADLAGSMQRKTGLEGALREDGPMLIVITALPAERAQGAPRESGEANVVMIMPVTDYSKVTASLRGASTREGVTEGVTTEGETVYVKQLGNFAVTGPVRATVAGYQAGGAGANWLTASGKLGGQYLDKSQAAVFFNMPVMRQRLLSGIDKGMAQMEKQMGSAPANTADQAAMAKVMMAAYADVAKNFVRDAEMAVVTLDASEMGVALTGAAQFTAGSKLAGYTAKSSAAAPLFNQLPNRPYIMAWSANADGLDLKALVTDVVKDLPDNAGPMVALIKSKLPLLSDVTSYAQAIYVPANVQPMAGGGLIQAASVITTRDPAAFKVAVQDYLAAMGTMSQPGGVTIKSTYTKDAMQINGVNVDRYAVDYQMPPEAMRGNPMAPMMAMMGLNAQQGFIAQQGDKLVMTSVSDVELMKAALEAAKSDKGLGQDKLIGQVRTEALPKDAAAEAYLNMAGVAQMANMFGMMFGMPPINAPANLPPVAWGMSGQDNGAALRMYVPVAVMTFVRDTAMQFQQPRPGMQPGTAPPPDFN